VSDLDEQRRQAIAMSEAAARQWARAMAAHISPPRDPGFPGRLSDLAEAARARARAARIGDAAGLRWVARPGALKSEPPYELRAGTGRPGPEDLWDRFDACVGAYNLAITGVDARVVADSADALADAAEAVARALAAGGERAPQAGGGRLAR